MMTTIRVGDNDHDNARATSKNWPTQQAKSERGSERTMDNDKNDNPTIENLSFLTISERTADNNKDDNPTIKN